MKQPYKKSSFKYWFAHWSAFQMTALNLGCWKFRFLFHDIEKPFLRLFLPYKTVKKIHKKIARHHGNGKDYLGRVIDWECSRLTKVEDILNAREKLYKEHPDLIDKIEPILKKLGL